MSSDSDVEYESADEESSTDKATKNSGSPNNDISVSTESQQTKFKDASPSHESNILLQDNSENKKSVNEGKVEDETSVRCIEVDVSSDKLLEVSDMKDNDKTENIEPTNIRTGDQSKKDDVKRPDSPKSNLESYKSRPEKQRVPLRLEKKIQQKSQTFEEAPQEKLLQGDVQEQNENQSSSWGFSSWGSSLLSTAASSVSTFTNQVSQGIGTVLETVESTLGAPTPEELAVNLSKSESLGSAAGKEESEGESNASESLDASSETRSSILPDVSAWTKAIENTGSKVIMGGLDTLELIGKKTIDIITEGDPGLRKKRSVFADGITLSQILREAKAEADESKQGASSEGINAVHYSQLFDEYQGLVHLEALEMLSKQSEAQIQRNLMRVPRNAEIRKQLEEIKSICENLPLLDDPSDTSSENFEDFDTVCKKHILELNLPFNVDNLIKAQKRITDVVKSYETATTVTSSPEEIYQSAICSLAEFTAKSIETFHKLSELILVQPNIESSIEHFATNLTGLTTIMCIEINGLSSRYHRCLDSIAEQSEDSNSQKTNITTIVTNLYVEASNSNKYIQDAFLLLVPVLQALQLESSQ